MFIELEIHCTLSRIQQNLSLDIVSKLNWNREIPGKPREVLLIASEI
jgi:hypothetical protein